MCYSMMGLTRCYKTAVFLHLYLHSACPFSQKDAVISGARRHFQRVL